MSSLLDGAICTEQCHRLRCTNAVFLCSSGGHGEERVDAVTLAILASIGLLSRFLPVCGKLASSRRITFVPGQPLVSFCTASLAGETANELRLALATADYKKGLP